MEVTVARGHLLTSTEGGTPYEDPSGAYAYDVFLHADIRRAARQQQMPALTMELTSSMKRTPGMISAFPSSRHCAILESICSRTSDRISPVSPANSARKPCKNQILMVIDPDITASI